LLVSSCTPKTVSKFALLVSSGNLIAIIKQVTEIAVRIMYGSTEAKSFNTNKTVGAMAPTDLDTRLKNPLLKLLISVSKISLV